MTDQETLAQRFRDLRREPDAPEWSNVLQRAGAVEKARRRPTNGPVLTWHPRRLQPRRSTAFIAFAAAITAMAFAGVAYSLTRPTLPFTAPTPEAIEEASRRAPGTQDTIHDAPRVDEQTWDLRSYENVRGEICFTHEVPGELVDTFCLSADKLFARGPLHAYPGARQIAANYPKTEWDNQWVYGIAHPDIKTLTLVRMDCSTVALSLDRHGVFNYVASREDIRSGRQMYKLIAQGANGEVLAERRVAIGLPKNAKDAGLEPPRPKDACR